MSCKEGFSFETDAIYETEISQITVKLKANGFIKYGDDFSKNGIVAGEITSPQLKDTIYIKANEFKFISMTCDKETYNRKNANDFVLSLTEYFNQHGIKNYNKNEIIELEDIIKATTYGPKGTFMKGQTEMIKVISVDFKTY